MTAALAEPDTEVEQARVCDCRIIDLNEYISCPNTAAWVYRMKCCAGSTFVCEQCRRMHIEMADVWGWRCRWCRTLGYQSDLVASMRRL